MFLQLLGIAEGKLEETARFSELAWLLRPDDARACVGVSLVEDISILPASNSTDELIFSLTSTRHVFREVQGDGRGAHLDSEHSTGLAWKYIAQE